MVREPYPTSPRTNDLFTEWCECGFKADSLEEISKHEHSRSKFSTEPPNSPAREGYCSVCRPRPDEHKRDDQTFCENHDRDDWQVKLEHEEERRREALEEMDQHRLEEDLNLDK